MLKTTFCSSPWFHFRITPAGYYIPCRWMSEWRPGDGQSDYNISDTSIAEFMNSPTMCAFRTQQLSGDSSPECQGCYYEDQHNKVSGRQKQLLKSAVTVDNFTKTFVSSPHWSNFNYSHKNSGQTNRAPVDIQIDLGNTCNSSCIMCNPTYSSRLAVEYPKLTAIAPDIFPIYAPVTNWSDNDALVDKFVNDLLAIDGIKYLHFLGGETLYLKSFYKICNALVAAGVSKDIIVGITTNGTIYSDELADIIKEFKQFHLGVSIETFDSLNDYIRYPSKIGEVKHNLDRFLALRDITSIQITLRITPSIYTIYRLDQVFEYMLANRVIAESCNILSDPTCLRIELLPDNLRKTAIAKLDQVIQRHGLVPNETIVNRRREDLVRPVISNLIFEYKQLLEAIQVPLDSEQERKNLVKFTKAFEQLHHNNILEHLPEYEEFLRSYGY
jgi:sulfatase maturation enzyme AslB (radical SAM superfamily)